MRLLFIIQKKAKVVTLIGMTKILSPSVLHIARSNINSLRRSEDEFHNRSLKQNFLAFYLKMDIVEESQIINFSSAG